MTRAEREQVRAASRAGRVAAGPAGSPVPLGAVELAAVAADEGDCVVMGDQAKGEPAVAEVAAGLVAHGFVAVHRSSSGHEWHHRMCGFRLTRHLPSTLATRSGYRPRTLTTPPQSWTRVIRCARW